jgi:hypothetical protein
MDNLIRYAWQQTVLDAFLSRSGDVAAKVKIADESIGARMRERHQLDSSEQVALDDALRALKVLSSEAKVEADKQRREETKYEENKRGEKRH